MHTRARRKKSVYIWVQYVVCPLAEALDNCAKILEPAVVVETRIVWQHEACCLFLVCNDCAHVLTRHTSTLEHWSLLEVPLSEWVSREVKNVYRTSTNGFSDTDSSNNNDTTRVRVRGTRTDIWSRKHICKTKLELECTSTSTCTMHECTILDTRTLYYCATRTFKWHMHSFSVCTRKVMQSSGTKYP